VEIIHVQSVLGSSMGDSGNKDWNYARYRLEMAWHYFWWEFGLEWGCHDCMDWAVGVVPQTGQGYLGAHGDGVATCLILSSIGEDI